MLRSDSKDARRRVRRGHKDGERRMARSGGVDARGARRDALAEREFCDERKEFRISVWSGGRRGERVSEEENERAEQRCGRGTRFERREGGRDDAGADGTAIAVLALQAQVHQLVVDEEMERFFAQLPP